MTDETVVRCLFRLVTLDAKAHRVIDNSFGHGHGCDVAMACGAVDLGANVRRMVETNVRLVEKPVNTLPGQILSSFCIVPDHDNPRVIRVADIGVAADADIHARNSGNRAFGYSHMAIRTTDGNVFRMNLVGKIQRLHRLRADAEKMFGGFRESRMRRSENGRTPSPRLIRIRLARDNRLDVRLRSATRQDRDNSGKQRNGNPSSHGRGRRPGTPADGTGISEHGILHLLQNELTPLSLIFLTFDGGAAAEGRPAL